MEDVDLLKKSSIKQNYIFLIDSKDRDRSADPTPSQYTVQFTTPFHNVVGFQVLHASIPRTMYNVDMYNNTIRFLIHDAQHAADAADVGRYVERRITPGEYTIQTLIAELNRTLRMPLNNVAGAVDVQISAESTTNPPETQSLLRFRCPYPFVVDMVGSSIAETIGFDLLADSAEAQATGTDRRYEPMTFPNETFLRTLLTVDAAAVAGTPPLDWDTAFSQQNVNAGAFFAITAWLLLRFNWRIEPAVHTPSLTPRGLADHIMNNVAMNRKVFHSVDLAPSVALGAERVAYDGPRGVVRKTGVGGGGVAQQFVVTAQTNLTQVFAALTTSDGLVGDNSKVTWQLYTDAGGAPGTPIPLTSPAGSPVTGFIPVSFTDGALSDQDDPVRVRLDPATYWIVFTAAVPGQVFVYYNDVPSNQASGSFLVHNGSGWQSLDTDDGIHFEACIRVVTQDDYHTLVAPGMYSLIGERYIVLRCSEIEENSYRSLAYQRNCLGLAKFQLGVIGYSETRQDFSTVPAREFHPIGKLPRLSLRFETPDGKLYDFKGVNHTLTVAIQYYEPIQKEGFAGSILNPNYQGDVMAYMRGVPEEVSSDEADFEYGRDDLRDFEANERFHLPDSIARRDREALHRFDDAM